eukprot:350975-Chlamydomonas_euryale.AAC.10
MVGRSCAAGGQVGRRALGRRRLEEGGRRSCMLHHPPRGVRATSMWCGDTECVGRPVWDEARAEVPHLTPAPLLLPLLHARRPGLEPVMPRMTPPRGPAPAVLSYQRRMRARPAAALPFNLENKMKDILTAPGRMTELLQQVRLRASRHTVFIPAAPSNTWVATALYVWGPVLVVVYTHSNTQMEVDSSLDVRVQTHSEYEHGPACMYVCMRACMYVRACFLHTTIPVSMRSGSAANADRDLMDRSMVVYKGAHAHTHACMPEH